MGWTYKTDDEIKTWKDQWLEENPTYNVEGENCQKFAYELIVELTDGVFSIPHRYGSIKAGRKDNELFLCFFISRFDASRAVSAKGSFGGFNLSLDGSRIKRFIAP